MVLRKRRFDTFVQGSSSAMTTFQMFLFSTGSKTVVWSANNSNQARHVRFEKSYFIVRRKRQ